MSQLVFAAFLLLTIVFVSTQAEQINPASYWNTTEYLERAGYPYQNHFVTTKDGYILHLIRVQRRYQTYIDENLPVIFWQHGLVDSSDGGTLLDGETESPVLYFANKGYDVWIGNSRGNRYSKNNIHYANNSRNFEFWNFTFQDMGRYDVPANFEYVLNKTYYSQKIHYIGHSQGTTQMFIALCEQIPIVLNHIGAYIALAPVVYVNHMNQSAFQSLAQNEKSIWKIANTIKEYEIQAWNQQLNRNQAILCSKFAMKCEDIVQAIMDADPAVDNVERMDVIGGHVPAGSSVKDFAHFGQFVKTGEFKMFDYGSKKENIKHYGQQIPPFWNLANIQIPVHLIAGDSDRLADPIDTHYLWHQLEKYTQVTYDEFSLGHGSFLFGKNMYPYLNKALEYIEAAEAQLKN